jgi:hypothetical protein
MYINHPIYDELLTITTELNARLIIAMIEGDMPYWVIGDSLQNQHENSAFYDSLPTIREGIMQAADLLLDTCGVEGWASEDGRSGVSYCNTGDSYARTLILDDGEFKVTSWADLLEEKEKEEAQ